jgi:hypothetical protein
MLAPSDRDQAEPTSPDRPRDGDRSYRERSSRGGNDRNERERGRGRFERSDRPTQTETPAPQTRSVPAPLAPAPVQPVASQPPVANTVSARPAEPSTNATADLARGSNEKAYAPRDSGTRDGLSRTRSASDVSRTERPTRNERFRDDRGARPQAPRSEPARNLGEVGRDRPERAVDDFSSVWQDSSNGPEADERPARPQAMVEAPRNEATRAGSRLYLNLGRKDRIRTDDVISLLVEAGTPVAREAVEVMSTHSYINVDEARAQELVAALNGREYNGRNLVCEVAKPRRERY